jgi:hypothetical protein
MWRAVIVIVYATFRPAARILSASAGNDRLDVLAETLAAHAVAPAMAI